MLRPVTRSAANEARSAVTYQDDLRMHRTVFVCDSCLTQVDRQPISWVGETIMFGVMVASRLGVVRGVFRG